MSKFFRVLTLCFSCSDDQALSPNRSKYSRIVAASMSLSNASLFGRKFGTKTQPT